MPVTYSPVPNFQLADDLTQLQGARATYEAKQATLNAAVAALGPLIAERDTAADGLNAAQATMVTDANSLHVTFTAGVP